MRWTDLVVNEDLRARYGELPDLTGVRLRAVHLDGWGATVTLRFDLSALPERREAGPGDTMQCRLQFFMVRDFVLEGWRPPLTADIALTALPEHRLAVEVTAPGAIASYTSNASLTVGGFSVFTRDADGGDSGRHHFSRPLEHKLHPTIPPPHNTTFHGRV
ncbi:hypothetical protein SUDANB120_05708 [Streptomyces sp. enrichment culture]|uniref:Imm50 family immunity protein n=1 Tax=Streptomyces TaxID=1883 RepID=UPI00167414BA|nr:MULTISPECIES: Imm50 family immunity protein [Streptomyces]MBD3575698.1 hypothetical protein [Streptomyces sp. KD18]